MKLESEMNGSGGRAAPDHSGWAASLFSRENLGGKFKFWREIQILAVNSNFGGKFNFFLRKIQILNKSIKTVTQSILKRIRWTMEWYKVNERTKKRMGFETRI